MTRADGTFTLKVDEPGSRALLSTFSQDMFLGVDLQQIGICRPNMAS